jgi:hypothetical protein
MKELVVSGLLFMAEKAHNVTASAMSHSDSYNKTVISRVFNASKK